MGVRYPVNGRPVAMNSCGRQRRSKGEREGSAWALQGDSKSYPYGLNITNSKRRLYKKLYKYPPTPHKPGVARQWEQAASGLDL